MKKRLLVLLSVLLLACLLIACDKGGDGKETSAPTDAPTEAATDDPSAGATDPATEPATDPAPETDAPTEAPTEADTESEELDLSVHIRFTEKIKDSKNTFSGPNQCSYEMVPDPDNEGFYLLKLTTKGSPANDPFVTFSYANYVKYVKAKRASATDYKYVAIRVKSESMTNGNFELFYCAGKVTGATGDCFTNVAFDNSDPDWQYVLFDLSRANWDGNINMFRLDFTTFAGDGEVLYISGIDLFKTEEEYYKAIGFDPAGDEEAYTESPEVKAKLDELLSADDSSKSSGYYSYKGETAAKESKDLTLSFKNMTDRTAKDDNATPGTVSYLIRMAKNEIEGTQAVLAASKDMTGLKVYLTDFVNKDGVTLTTDLLWGYYFDVDGKDIIDPLPPVKYAEDLQPGDLDWNNAGNHAGAYIPNYQKYNGFDIKAGENQTFVIKAHTAMDTPAGEYTAVLTVKDKDGNEIKKATVYAWVWNFALSDSTACKTLADISWFAIYSNHKCFNGDDGYLYQLYYDYMLENRFCGYDIPYNDKEGTFSDSRAIAYLDNPRVTAFQAIGWKTDLTAGKASRAYQFLSAHDEWIAKSYFYPIDEPNLGVDPQILNKINSFGQLLKENFPGYKLIVPMHVNGAVSGGDYFSYVSEYVNAWCPHTFFYNTFDEYRSNRKLTYRISAALEKKLGTFPDRMAAEQAGGDEVWWYVTRFPQVPEITLTMNTASINYRILFWQQKLYNVDGFLYYSVTDWFDSADFAPTQADFPGYDGPISGDGAPTVARPIGLNSKHETDNSYPFNVYGNGVLVYVGQYFGEYGPVGCYRLECVRDGIEDFEYLTMLQNVYGKETVDQIIRRITTSLSRYTDDETYFNEVRNALGCLLEKELNK
ncbi:MAG: DUF4091 domain-containing protein [Clostridia bacterium]|nr:DUF4091 domain-containing protein [Clostridia bacterium]